MLRMDVIAGFIGFYDSSITNKAKLASPSRLVACKPIRIWPNHACLGQNRMPHLFLGDQ